MNTTKLVSIIISLFCCSLFAQQVPTQFTLQDAIDYALQNNRQAINAQRDIEAAEKQKWETTAIGLPQINAKANYQNFLKQQVSVVPAEFFGGNPGEFAEVIFGTKQNANATATLSQLLFDGSYLVGLQSVKVFLDISKNAKIKTDLEIRKAVINAYGNVLLASESVAILQKNITVVTKNRNDTKNIFENGLTELESVEQLDITLSGLKSNLNNAKRLQGIAKQMFNITIGIPFNADTKLTESLEAITLSQMNLVDPASFDVKSTIDYKIAQNETTAKELQVKLEKSKALPQLSANINGGYLGFSNSFTFLDSNQPWSGFSSFGFNLNVPLFSSGKRSAASQRAKINFEKAKTNLADTEERLNLQLQTAKSNYTFALEDYDIKKQNLDLAQRIESKNQIKFFEGIATSFELQQAQTQLYTAQQNLLQSMLNVITAKADLDTLTNTTN